LPAPWAYPPRSQPGANAYLASCVLARGALDGDGQLGLAGLVPALQGLLGLGVDGELDHLAVDLLTEDGATEVHGLVVAQELDPASGVHPHHVVHEGHQLVTVGAAVHQVTDLDHDGVLVELAGLDVKADVLDQGVHEGTVVPADVAVHEDVHVRQTTRRLRPSPPTG
jgi:hypothetical protein